MGLRKFTTLVIILISSLFSLAFSTSGNYQLTDTSNGFTIEVKNIGTRVQGTYLPPGKGNWVAYWLYYDSSESDLFFVNAITKQAKRIGFSRVNDGQYDHSIDFVRPIGFLSESDFIYTSARVVNKKVIYSIRSFHISSGKETLLFDNVLKNIDFYRGPIWLNKKKDVLMMASNTGEIVHYNLKKRNLFVLKKKFPAEWPYDAISISSTGNYFEAEDIYDLNGTVLNKTHNKNPNVKASQNIFKRTEFGLDDNYVARSYTFDDSDKHILDPQTAMFDYSFATQAIDIERVSGELVRRIQIKPGSNRYVELHSWLSPETVVLHYFKLKPVENEDPVIINSSYVKYDIRTGKSKNIPTPQPKYEDQRSFTLRKEWEIQVRQDFRQDKKSDKVIKDNAIIQYTKVSSKGVK